MKYHAVKSELSSYKTLTYCGKRLNMGWNFCADLQHFIKHMVPEERCSQCFDKLQQIIKTN